MSCIKVEQFVERLDVCGICLQFRLIGPATVWKIYVLFDFSIFLSILNP